MSFSRGVLGALALSLGMGSVAAAQDHAIRLFAQGGGYNAVANLNDVGSADFKKLGYTVGLGVGVELNRYLTIRGEGSFGRNELRNNTVGTGLMTNRFFYDAAVQLQYPTSTGLEPYVYAGGGGVTIHPVGTSGRDRTKGAGTFGLGLNYQIPRSGLGLFVEGKGWVYQFNGFSGQLAGFDKTQVDLTWSGGLSYRFGF
jgi:Outer membrane protein beta-barrel domain